MPLSINTRAIKYCGSGLSMIGVNTKKEIVNLRNSASFFLSYLKIMKRRV